MIKGHIKRERRRKRVCKNITKVTIASAVVACGITAGMNVYSYNTRQDAAKDINKVIKTSAVAVETEADKVDNMAISVVASDNELLTSSYEEANNDTVAKAASVVNATLNDEVIDKAIDNAQKKKEKAQLEKIANSGKKCKSRLVAQQTVNVREMPSQNSDRLGSFKKGSLVDTLSLCSNGWYKVSYNGDEGFVHGDYLDEVAPMLKVEATAYWNKYNRKTADGSSCKTGITLAGKRSWLGKACYIYRCNSDGSVGECLGYREFHDTGYGKNGDIPRGETIDIYMPTESECRQWGRKNVYIQFIN